MKKTVFILLAVATTWLFTACTGAKKTEEAPATEPAKTEVQPVVETPAPVELAPAEMLKAFQKFAKDFGEAYNNVVKDPQKYTTLASQVQEKVADMERVKGKLNAQQVKDYEKALRIIMDVSSGGSKAKK